MILDTLTVAIPEYHRFQSKPRSLQELADRYEHHLGILGLWEVKSTNIFTGESRRLWAKNVITDVGATSMLKNTWNNAGSAVAIYNQIAITTNAGSSTLTSALTSGNTYTSLAVAAIPGPIANGVTVTIGYGTGQTQNVVLSGSATLGATSLSITSFVANANYAIGSNVVPVPAVTDNPSSLGGTVSYSGALPGGDFVFSGSGLGNRQVQIQYTFPASPTTTTGSYNELWTVNTNPVSGTGQVANHLIGTASVIDNSHSLTVTIIEKA